MKKFLIIIVVELILFGISRSFQPDLAISDDGKILNSAERIEAFKNAFAYTLPIQLALIMMLFRGVKLKPKDDNGIQRKSIENAVTAFTGMVIITLIYLSNSISRV